MLEQILTELIDKIGTKRDVKTEITEYGVYGSRSEEYIYSDRDKIYQPISKHKTRRLNVSSVDSFIGFIGEELKRLNNKTGKKTTVIINSVGGYFSADDNFMDIECNYCRALTTLWKTMTEVANTRMGHEDLLTTLQRLKPCIPNFEEIYRNLLDIRTIGRSEMISNPVFIDGEAGAGYKISFKLQNGASDEAILPSEFKCIVPFSKGRPQITYEIPVELMFLNNGHGKVEILFQCPEIERIAEQALQDEAEYLTEELKQFEELLVLLNY